MCIVTQKVWNPNLLSDVVRILSLNIDKNDLQQRLDQIKKSKVTSYEKLETLMDRIEFIKHLKIVSKEAQNNYFEFNREEVVGIDWDIDALRLYLSLTCIDIFSSNFETFDDWLVNNCHDFDCDQDFREYICGKSKIYNNEFRVVSNFAGAFHKSSSLLKNKITQNLSIVNSSGKRNNLESLISYFYRIRNKYTHEGRRFHQTPIPYAREQSIGQRDKEKLYIAPCIDLIELLIDVAKEQAIRTLDLESFSKI